jgi:CubicO group peptidase (beta-lactamase class C family)
MNRLRFARVTLVIVLLAGALGAAGVESLAQDEEGVYQDPAGRFSFPVPSTWTVEERDGYVLLSDPEGDMTGAFVVVPAEDVRQGIDVAWEIVDPAFDGEPVPGTDQMPPSDPGVDDTLILTYDTGETSGQIVQAVGQRVGDQVYVILFQGSLEAAVRRNAQIQVVFTGFEITSLEQIDLSGQTAQPFEGALVDEFEAFAADLLARLDIPGATIAVVQRGEVVYSGAFGVKAQDGSDLMTPDTLMMIGSSTKPFTTTMMASMVDEGLVAWETPAVEILPGFAFADPELTQQVTMQNLVCACTGVPRRDLELTFNANELTAEDVIGSLADFTMYTDFGETFQYSNQLVATAGYVAASAAGGIYGDLDDAYARELQNRVLDPLGMSRTTLSYLAAANDADVAMPHGIRLDGTYVPISLEYEALLEPVAPSGGLWSTAPEVGQFLIMQLNDGVTAGGTRIASEENVVKTREPQVDVSAGVSYGLGWFVEDYHGQTIVHHGGNTFGFTSDVAFLPDAGLGVVVLSNAQGANLFNEIVRYRLLELLFDHPGEIEETLAFALQSSEESLAETMETVGDPASADDVAEFLGMYSEPALGEIELGWTAEEGLTMDAGEFVTALRPLTDAGAGEPNVVTFDPPLAGLPIELTTGDDGQPVAIIDIGADVYQFEMVEPASTEMATPEAVPSPVAAPEAA